VKYLKKEILSKKHLLFVFYQPRLKDRDLVQQSKNF